MLQLPSRRMLLGSKREISMVCPAITPAPVGEIVVNADMELNSDWLGQGTPTSQAQSNEQAHGGTYSWKVVSDAANEGIRQALSATIGQWYTASAWAYVSGGSCYLVVNGLVVAAGPVANAAAWAQLLMTNRATSATPSILIQSSAAVSTFYADDASFQQMSFATMLARLGTLDRKSGTWTCKPTVADWTQCGLLLNYASPTNFVMLIVNRVGTDQAQLLSCLNGSWASVIAGNITYGAAKELKVIVNSGQYSLYYDGAQIGTTQNIDGSTLGFQCHGFNTFAGNTVGLVTTSPATVPF